MARDARDQSPGRRQPVTEAGLELLLSQPTDPLVDAFRTLDGDIMILGAGGKMGPSLARLARRASDAAGVTRRVMAVARFTTPGLRHGARCRRHRDHRRRSVRRRPARRASRLRQRDLHGRPEVRHQRRPAAHLGDQRRGSRVPWPSALPAPGSWRSPPATSIRSGRWRAPAPTNPPNPAPVGEYAQSALGARTDPGVLFATLGNPDGAAATQLCRRTALRRAARHRRARLPR